MLFHIGGRHGQGGIRAYVNYTEGPAFLEREHPICFSNVKCIKILFLTSFMNLIIKIWIIFSQMNSNLNH